MTITGLKKGQNGTAHINKKIPTTGTPICSVASKGTLTIAEPVTNNDTITIGDTTYTFKTGATYAKAQGTLAMGTIPVATNTMTIGTKVYTFKAIGGATADGHIDIGADVAASKLAVVAAINGTDGLNTPHPLVTAAAFVGDNMIITAILPGTAGNAIATTETFGPAGNVFDAVTLGTTTVGALLVAGQIGIGASEAATKLAIVAAINGTDLVNAVNTDVVATAFAGDAGVMTARFAGVSGDLIATTETLTHASNVWDDTTLGTTAAGVDGTDGDPGDQLIDSTYLYICVAPPSTAGNWRRISLGSAF